MCSIGAHIDVDTNNPNTQYNVCGAVIMTKSFIRPKLSDSVCESTLGYAAIVYSNHHQFTIYCDDDATGDCGVQEKYEWWWIYMCDAKRKQLLAGPMQICTLGDRDEVFSTVSSCC